MTDQRTVTAIELANKTSLSHREARRLLTASPLSGVGEVHIVVFHMKCSNDPVQWRPYPHGPPLPPWGCPGCGENITDRAELCYDIELRLQERDDD